MDANIYSIEKSEILKIFLAESEVVNKLLMMNGKLSEFRVCLHGVMGNEKIMAENKVSGHFFKDIEYLRGAACALVLIQHIMWIRPIIFIQALIPECLWIGSGGFHIFFAISGFVITYSLKDRLGGLSGDIFAKRLREFQNFLVSFYKRRFFRIVPVLILLIFSGAIFFTFTDFTVVQGKTEWARDLFRAPFEILFGTFNYSVSEFQFSARIYGGGIGPLWTLAVESQFYLMWPIVLLFCRDNDQRMTWSLILGCVFLFVVGPITSVYFPHKYYMPYNNLSELFLGSFFAFIYDEKFKKSANLGAKIFAFILFMIIWGYPNSWKDGTPFYSDVVLNVASVLLLFTAVYFEGSCEVPFLKHILSYLGSRSYSFYTIQLLLANVTVWFTNSVYFPAESFTKYQFYMVQFIIYIVVLVFSTEIVYRLIEKPARMLGRK